MVKLLLIMAFFVTPANAAIVSYDFSEMGWIDGETWTPLSLDNSEIGPTVHYSESHGGVLTGDGDLYIIWEPETHCVSLTFLSDFLPEPLIFGIKGTGISMFTWAGKPNTYGLGELEYCKVSPVSLPNSLLFIVTGMGLLFARRKLW